MVGMRQQKTTDSGINFLCSPSSTKRVFMVCMLHQEENNCVEFKDVISISVVVKDVY